MMVCLKILGLLVLCSIAVSELITFKPFIKSRYSLRLRSKTTTRSPSAKSNETIANPNLEANIQQSSTQIPTQHLNVTVMTLTDSNLQKNINETSASNDTLIVSEAVTPVYGIDIAPTTTITNKMEDSMRTSTSTLLNTQPQTITSTQQVKITTSTPSTTQAEWVYDYYASDDENPRKN